MVTLGTFEYFINLKFFRPLSLKEALDYLDELLAEEDQAKTLFIEPPEVEDGVISGEDDADEEEDGVPDNVCPGQLKTNCEIVFNNGERIGILENTDNNSELSEIEVFEDHLSSEPSTCTGVTNSILLQKIQPTDLHKLILLT